MPIFVLNFRHEQEQALLFQSKYDNVESSIDVSFKIHNWKYDVKLIPTQQLPSRMISNKLSDYSLQLTL